MTSSPIGSFEILTTTPLGSPINNLKSRLVYSEMYFSKPLPEGRKSYSVPKQELRSTRCFTTLEVKRAVNEPACDSALGKLRYDLARQLSKRNIKVPVSTENKISGNWIALIMPDAAPSRLGLMTRIASLVTMCSEAENRPAPENITCDNFSQPFARDLAETLPAPLDHHHTSDRRCNARAHQAIHNTIFEISIEPVLYDLTSTDRSQGLEVLHAWYNQFHKSSTAISAAETPSSLGEYMHKCSHLFPGYPWMSTLRYALGLHLEDAELETIEPAVAAAMQSVALTRDYWAWPQASRSTDNIKRLRNAVAISMVEMQCSEAQALSTVKNAAIAAESRFLDRRWSLMEVMGTEHSEVVMLLDAVEHFAAGNSLWCSSCPLYHGRR